MTGQPSGEGGPDFIEGQLASARGQGFKNASSPVTVGLRSMDSEASHTLAQLYGTHCH